MWSADQYLNSLYQKSVASHSNVYGKAERLDLKNEFQQLLGDFEEKNEDLEPLLLEQSDMGSYLRLRVELTTIHPLKMPVYLLIPKNRGVTKLPAVLALHGHGCGSKEAVGLNPDGSERKDQGYHKQFAIELVEKGIIVIVPELIGFGDRKLQSDQGGSSPTDNSCYMIASQLLLLGKTLAGLRVEECRRAIDYLQTLEEVDERQIGCMGISGGGLVASFTSILDERIKATVISGYTSTFKGSIMDRRHCLDNYIPGLLKYTEMPDLIGLIAPRPLFIESGTTDHLFPLKDSLAAIGRLTEIYRELDAETSFSSHVFEGGHEICGEKSFEWLIHQLSIAT
ncbi:dienelactone hydrolase family protein [Sporosarcina beigongshangi]|uniref:dienelactone hydrolase family protein n=1 Tax=Sporosarcina beigongshangi TaxID=2782538 RepID=UPI0019393E02|nr:alpha/beta hydrolase family protein [Sporosarcina beigongshangi]